MFIKQVTRKCSVRGCKNTDCFAISRTREIGNTVIICKSCLGKALGAVDEIDPETKSNIPVPDNTAAPPLFFNDAALGVKADAVNVTEQPPEAAPENKEPEQTDGEPTPPAADGATGFVCPTCNKEFANERGLKTHLRYCKPQSDKE